MLCTPQLKNIWYVSGSSQDCGHYIEVSIFYALHNNLDLFFTLNLTSNNSPSCPRLCSKIILFSTCGNARVIYIFLFSCACWGLIINFLRQCYLFLIEKIKVNMDLWKEPNKLQSILKHWMVWQTGYKWVMYRRVSTI